jgi:hypothetical protein
MAVLSWMLKGSTAYIMYILVKWTTSYNSAMLWWAFGVAGSLSIGGWLLLVLTLSLVFGYLVPRLLGLGLSLLVFKAMTNLPFHLSVGSATLNRLTNVLISMRSRPGRSHTASIRILELAMVPNFLQWNTQAKKGNRKLITILIRGIRAEFTLNEDATDVNTPATSAAERGAAPHDPHAFRDMKKKGVLPDKRTSLGSQMKASLMPWAARLTTYIVSSFVELSVVDASALFEVPDLGSVMYTLEQLSLSANRC